MITVQINDDDDDDDDANDADDDDVFRGSNHSVQL